jgi:hypothetical protein
MDTLLGIILGAGSFISLAYCASRLIAAMVRNRPKLPPLACYGDFPFVPEEARQGAKSRRGRGAVKAPCAQTQTISAIARHGTGL